MENFVYEYPTKVYFGKGAAKQHLAGILAAYGPNVLLAYGGGSIKKNGVYEEITGILKEAGKRITEFAGIMSNPTWEKVKEGAGLARDRAGGAARRRLCGRRPGADRPIGAAGRPGAGRRAPAGPAAGHRGHGPLPRHHRRVRLCGAHPDAAGGGQPECGRRRGRRLLGAGGFPAGGPANPK